MAYIKCGVVTKINIEKNKKQAIDYLNKSFNLELYKKNKNSYYLNSDILSSNIKDFRNEFLEFSSFYGDSLDDCEAYCLETSIDKLIKKKIYLCNDNEKYYFSNYENHKFDTDEVIVTTSNFSIKIFMIPIFWDIYRVIVENFEMVSELINNLIHKCIKNPLKDASFFTVV